MPTPHHEDFVDYLTARLHNFAFADGAPRPRVTDLEQLLASGVPLGFSLGPWGASSVSGRQTGYRSLVLHDMATHVKHSVFLVRNVTFTKPQVPGFPGPNGRQNGVEYAEVTLPLAQVGPLWNGVRARCPAAGFHKTRDQHTPRLRLWANRGVNGHPGLVVFGWPVAPTQADSGTDDAEEEGEHAPSDTPAEGVPGGVGVPPRAAPPPAPAAAAAHSDSAAHAGGGAEPPAAASAAADGPAADAPPDAPPPAAASPPAGSGGVVATAAAPPVSSEWYDPWPAGALQGTTDLWSWLSVVDGPAVMADAVIHLSRRCVAEAYGVAGHNEATCTACELSLQVHKVLPHK